MNFRIIYSPSAETLEMLTRRSGMKKAQTGCGAIGLFQGKLIDMVYAMDLALKAAGVTVEDIRGNCPQSIIMIAIYGDTSAVEEAVDQIRNKLEYGKVGDRK